MSAEEGFLARWSRRKREVTEAEREPDAPQPPPAESTDAAPNEQEENEKPVDLSKLPPLGSIAGDTDVRAFLAAGVPPSLASAALRRAWTSDPTIRDFVGLSENAWDFNAPAGVPGFGPLQATEEIKRIAKQILGDEPETGARSSAGSSDQADREQQDGPLHQSIGNSIPNNGKENSEPPENKLADVASEAHGSGENTNEDIAAQQKTAASEDIGSRPRGGHGGALPG